MTWTLYKCGILLKIVVDILKSYQNIPMSSWAYTSINSMKYKYYILLTVKENAYYVFVSRFCANTLRPLVWRWKTAKSIRRQHQRLNCCFHPLHSLKMTVPWWNKAPDKLPLKLNDFTKLVFTFIHCLHHAYCRGMYCVCNALMEHVLTYLVFYQLPLYALFHRRRLESCYQ